MGNNMYSDLFVRVLNISMVSCYTIVVVMVLRALILRWERKYAYLLWFVVFVNLCLPFRISGPFSLVPAWIADFDIAGQSEEKMQVGYEGKTDYLPNEHITETMILNEESEGTVHHYDTPAEGGNSVPGTDSNSDTIYIPQGYEGKTDYLPNEQIIDTFVSNEEAVGTVNHYYTSAEGENGVPGTDSNSATAYYANGRINRGSRKTFLALVWGIGVFLLAAGNIRAVLKLCRKLKGAELYSADNTSGEGANEGVKTVDGIETPFLWGIISPAIYLPQVVDEEERTYIIAHESYHRKRKDYIFKPLFFMVAVIHWFNPLVWAAYLLFVRDMEISCDEAVIANADKDIRKKYAESLLKYAARQNGYTLTPITFGEPSLKCRIKNVLHYKERSVVISALVLCIVIVIMTGLVFKPRQTKLTVVTDGHEEAQILEEAPITSDSAVDKVVDKEDILSDPAVSPRELNWKPGMIEGTDGENQYTKILLDSDLTTGKVSDFRTFAFDIDNESDSIAYVMAGDIDGESIIGSLWRVVRKTGVVYPVMQNISMADTQIESLVFENAVYGVFNYQTDSGTDGRIFPFVSNVSSTAEMMPDICGEKRVGDVEGTIISGDYAYWLIDAETVKAVGEYDISQDEGEWNPETESKRSDKAENYQIGQEYELTHAEQMRLNGLVPYFVDDMSAFFDYCDKTVMLKGRARRKNAYAQINQIGRTQDFDVYGTNLIDTMLVRTPDEKYLRIDHRFSSNYNEVPFIYEADFDTDGEQELVIMGGFGYHGTGIYLEQLFIVDRGKDEIWRAYELHDDIYLPMIRQHIDSVYSEKGLELQIDGKGVGYFFDEDGIVDASAEYAAGAWIFFGYGKSGIIPQFASVKNRILGSEDESDKKIVLDALLGVYSDNCVSGIAPGNHFVAALTYEGDGKWSLAEYHHEFHY